MERKTFASYTVGINEPEGIVEKIVAVMGNVDQGKDRIWPGAFSKTIQERGLKIKGLDQHDSRSVRNVVAKTLEMRELGQHELPPDLLTQYPEATGALWVKAKYMLGTQPGREVFHLIQEGAISESSIGYDPIVTDFSTIETADGKQTVRNLRELKLYEWSDVVWAMNPATSNLSAKEAGPEEGKPWRVFERDGKFEVYKVDADGEPVGESLGSHDTREEAQAQVRALYANEPDEEMADEGAGEEKAVMKTEADGQHPASHYLIVEDREKPSTWHLRVRNASGEVDHRLMGAAWAALHGGYRGNRYEGPGKGEALAKLRRLYSSENLDTPKAGDGPEDTKAGRVIAARNVARLNRIMTELTDLLKDGGLWADEEEKSDHDAPAETQAADDTPEDEEAGPEIPPTSERMAMIRKLELELLEVEQ